MASSQVDFHFVPNGRGGRYLIYNGYRFCIKSRRNERVYWKCVTRDCRATANTLDDMVTTNSGNHNHDPDVDNICANIVIADLKKKVTATSAPIPSLYREEIANLRTDETHPSIIAKVPTFPSLKSALYRARSKTRPNLPKQRSDIQLPDIYTKTATGEDFLIANDGDQDKILIFSTFNNLRLLSSTDKIFCDGTFDKSPATFLQLYTIHGFVEGKMCPLVYGLLPNKTQATYMRFFGLVKQKAADMNIHLSPQLAFTDYETAAQNAITATFPAVSLKGCLFHYGQSILKNIKKFHLQSIYDSKNETAQKTPLKRAFALPLVPELQVSDAWFEILSDYEEGDHTALEGNITRFCDYVTEYWVEGSHGTSLWNHHQTNGPRTTNHVEGWHRKLQQVIPGCHPNIYTFIDFLKKEQSFNEATFIQLMHGGKVEKCRRKYRRVEHVLDDLKSDLAGNRIELLEYIDSVSSIVKH